MRPDPLPPELRPLSDRALALSLGACLLALAALSLTERAAAMGKRPAAAPAEPAAPLDLCDRADYGSVVDGRLVQFLSRAQYEAYIKAGGAACRVVLINNRMEVKP